MPLPELHDERELYGEDENATVPDGFTFYENTDLLRRHEQRRLIDFGDAPTNKWLRERGFRPDGEPYVYGGNAASTEEVA